MKILNYFFETHLEFSEPVRDHDFVLRCMPPNTGAQTVMDAQIIVEPPASLAAQVDGFGNNLQVGRLEAPHSSFSFVSSGMVMVDSANVSPEPAHPIYLRPSELASAGPRVREFVGDVLRVSANLPALQKARRLSDAVAGALAYEKGATDVRTCGEDAFAGGRGVCQDFAHVLIALSHGRDFADCPIERGVFVGGARQSMSVSVRVTDDASLTW